MMSVASMPATLALPASNMANAEEQPEGDDANNYQSSKVQMMAAGQNMRMSMDQLQ